MRKRKVAPVDSPSGQNADRVQMKKETQSPWWLWLKRGLFALLLIYILVPFMPSISSDFIKHHVYVRRTRFPFFLDLSRPEELNHSHTINMYLTSEEDVSLGVWHTVPANRWKESQGKDLTWYQESLDDGSPIFIYLHGDGGTRAASHRVGVAKVLSALGYHALVMDYRGFGDSSGEPTEDGLSTDAIYLYNWVKARSGNSLVVIWGHSLGSGVAANIAVKLMGEGVILDGIILEGSFKQGICRYIFSWYYWVVPAFQYFFADKTEGNKMAFFTNENLKTIKSPLLFLHSEDDHLTPISDVRQMYDLAVSIQNPDRVKMESFSGSLGYLHNGLYKDSRTPGIIKEFVLSLQRWKSD